MYSSNPISSDSRYSYDLSTLESSVLENPDAGNWRHIVIGEQWKLNRLSPHEISEFEFYKNASRFKKEDLYHKGNLLQFLLMLNLDNQGPKYLFIQEGGFSIPTTCIKLGLEECACQHRSKGEELRLNEPGFREYSNQRVLFEDRFFFNMPRSLCQNKNIPLVFTAIGAGGCLQEWILLSNLILMGFTRLEIHLVDYVELNKQENLKNFFENFPGISASVFQHRFMSEFSKKNIVSDIIVAMDWMQKEEDQSTLLISERGFSYFTHFEPPWKIEKQQDAGRTV